MWSKYELKLSEIIPSIIKEDLNYNWCISIYSKIIINMPALACGFDISIADDIACWFKQHNFDVDYIPSSRLILFKQLEHATVFFYKFNCLTREEIRKMLDEELNNG
jgi:hypothetical protein